MANANTTENRARRVEVNTAPGRWQPGTVRPDLSDSMIAVQIDGEGTRVDLWHASQVRGL